MPSSHSQKQTQNENLNMRTLAQKAADIRKANKAAKEQRAQELLKSNEFLYHLSIPDTNTTS